MSSNTTNAAASVLPRHADHAPALSGKSDALLIAGLLLLCLVPVIAGMVRLVELSTAAEVTAANARFFAQPLPVVIHIVTVTLYAVLGAFQFSAGIRRRAPRWHRRAGRVLVVCGLLAAGSGLWMSLFYQLPEIDGELLLAFRLVFGVGMMLALLLGVRAAMRRDFLRHRAWMVRAYAIALGAGTQVFTHVPWMVLMGMPGEQARAWLMGAGWMLNLAVAEVVIRRRTPVLPAPPRTEQPLGALSKA